MKKLTIVKVLPVDGVVSSSDLERWKKIFENNEMTDEQAMATGKVQIEYIPESTKNTIMLVRLGGPTFTPSVGDLESFRDIFEEASKDPDFKIFTHPEVSIEVIDVGDIVAVE